MAMPFASLTPAAGHRTSPIFPPFCRSTPLSAAAAEEAQQHMMSARWAERPATFTAAQYEELEHQALIYKYLVAGVPVPPDLLLPIRRGLDSLASRFYHHHPALGYGSYFGKKLDPEPGRCKRTDGKKWRCSKEAAQDSKYCERHMHRGRSRSRKPVETQLVAQQPAALTPATAGFQNHSLYPAIANGGGAGGCGTFALGSSPLHMDNAVAYTTAGGRGNKDFRYSAYGVRSLADEHSQLITGSMDSSLDNFSWRLLPPQTSPYPVSSYPLLADLEQNTFSPPAKLEREPLSFLGSDFSTAHSVKQENNQTLRPFFDEWPKARDDNSLASFSATQLSISIPMTTSDFSNSCSRSPNDE